MVVRIAVVSDMHWPAFDRLDTLYDRIVESGAEAVALTGDLIDDSIEHPEHLETVRAWLARFDARGIPWFAIPGNHDVGDHPGVATYSPAILERCLAFWRRTMGADYHHLALGDVELIALNTGLFGTGCGEEQEQWAWLDNELASTAGSNLLLFVHHPLFLSEPDEEPDLNWVMDAASRDRLFTVADTHNLRAVVSGHIHRAFDQTWKGTRFLSCLSLCKSLDPVRPQTGWQIIEIHDDHVCLESVT